MKAILMVVLGIISAVGVLGSNFVGHAKALWMVVGLAACVALILIVATDKMNEPQR